MSLKDRLFVWTESLPLIGRAADPFMAASLVGIVLLTVAGVAIPTKIFPHDREARSHVLQLAGGVIVVVGVYFAAVNLRALRAAQLADRLTETIGHLGNAAEPVRIGAIRLLEGMAHEDSNLPKDTAGRAAASAQRQAIMAALSAVGRDGNTEPAKAARDAHDAIAQLRRAP